MLVKYLVTLHGKSSGKFRITYKNAKFQKLEWISGTVNQQVHEALLVLAPQLEQAILILREQWKGKVTYTTENQTTKSLHNDMYGEYASWYQEQTKTPHLMDGAEGKNLAQIITKMRKIEPDELVIFETWQAMLANWQNLESFYQNQRTLKQINSNINNLLVQIKNGKARNTAIAKGGETLGDAFARRFGQSNSS